MHLRTSLAGAAVDAAHRPAAPVGSTDPIGAIDQCTAWPTHRLRWFLQSQQALTWPPRALANPGGEALPAAATPQAPEGAAHGPRP